MTVEELIRKQFGVSTQEFIDTYSSVVPAYYSRIVSAIDANDVEILQPIIDEINMVQNTGDVPEEEQLQNAGTIQEQITAEAENILSEFVGGGSSRQIYTKNDEGKFVLSSLPSNFSAGFTALFNISQQPELLAELQDSFIKNNIVEPDFFDDEEDVFGEKTQAVLSAVMEYADKTIFIEQDSVEGQELIQKYAGSYGFLEGDPENVQFSMAVLDLAVEGLSQSKKSQEELQSKLEDEAALQQLASQFDIPTELEMEESVDELIGSIVPNRKATAAEKDRYATRLAELYSTKWKELTALEKAVRTNNMFQTVQVTRPFEGRDVTIPEQQLRQDIFQVTDPEVTIEAEIQKDLEGEVSAIEKGNAARKQQASLIAAMLGQI